jgi:archaellum biogenesis protein FlaJ (TadC family)
MQGGPVKRKSNEPRLTHNLISLLGIVLAAIGFVVGATLIVIDMQTNFDNPYTGIFTYMVVPAILAGVLFLILVGALK